MRQGETRTLRLRAPAAALGALLMLMACDDLSGRFDRIKDIAETSSDQISGRRVVEPAGDVRDSVDILDRAVAGTVIADITFDEDERPRFAIGSIIAKPRDIPEVPRGLESMADMEPSEDDLDLDLLEDILTQSDALPAALPEPAPPPAPVMPEPPAPEAAPMRQAEPLLVEPAQVMPRVRIDPRSATRTQQEIAQAGRDIEQIVITEPQPSQRIQEIRQRPSEPRQTDSPERQRLRELMQQRPEQRDLREIRQLVEANPDLREEIAQRSAERAEIRKLARRAPISGETLRVQINTNELMADTLTQYGLGGEISLSRGGQMVIQIGADGASPTQFRGEGTTSESFMALVADAQCPEGVPVEQIRRDPVVATACVIRDLEASEQFAYVEKDYIFENQFVRRPADGTPPAGHGALPQPVPPTPSGVGGLSTLIPNDPLWSMQWHFRDAGSGDGRAPGGANFESFWQNHRIVGSRRMIVAVVDTGLQLDHPDIVASPNILAGWDMVSDPRMANDGDGRDPDPTDPGDQCHPDRGADSFHGTHVAGIIGAAATNNNSGIAGGAWRVGVVPVRALGKCGGRLSDINDAIRWAAGLIPAEHPDGSEVWNENPADIINLSIGLPASCPASLQDAINAASESGAIIVSAAGNARMPTRFYAPAGCNNVITVAAGDARGHLTPYSNYGDEVTLLAPGGDLSRDDNSDGRPDGILSTKRASNCYDPVTGVGVDQCFYAYEQGTSMAAPHVSAALALLKTRNPRASNADLLTSLQKAMEPRSERQCVGACSLYPGATPLPDEPALCRRPCGEGMLNLSRIPVLPYSGLEP